MGKKSRSGSGMNIPDHISESVESIFGLKIFKFFDADPDPGLKSSVPGSGINIPDPQHCINPLKCSFWKISAKPQTSRMHLIFIRELYYGTCPFNKFYVYFEHNYCFINLNVKTYF